MSDESGVEVPDSEESGEVPRRFQYRGALLTAVLSARRQQWRLTVSLRWLASMPTKA
jgi:hypothetical protein